MQVINLPSIRLRERVKVLVGVHRPLAGSWNTELDIVVDLRIATPVQIRLSPEAGGQRLQVFPLPGHETVDLDVDIVDFGLHRTPLEALLSRLNPVVQVADALVSTLRTRIAADVASAWRPADGEPLLDDLIDDSESGRALVNWALRGCFGNGQGVTESAGSLNRTIARLQPVEIHLLAAERRRAKATRDWTAERAGTGRLLVFDRSVRDAGSAWNRQQTMLALAGSLHPGDPGRWTISFTDRRTLSASQLSNLLVPLASSYSIRLPEQIQRDPLEASFTVSLPESACSIWLHAPSDHETGCGPAWAAVSIALQRALRSWLPYLYFTSRDPVVDPEAAWALLVYSASRPYRAKSRAELSWDILNSKTLRRVGRSASAALGPLLLRIDDVFMSQHADMFAGSYRPLRESHLMRFVIRDRKLLNTLLAAEAFLVEEFVKLGVAIRTPTGEIRDVRALARTAAGFARTLEIRLRKWYCGWDLSSIMPLLLIEATNALAMHRGRPDFLGAEICLASISRGQAAGSIRTAPTCQRARFYCIKKQPWG